jgi:hypothetical protein
MKVDRGRGVRSILVDITPRPLYPLERKLLANEQEGGWAPDTV